MQSINCVRISSRSQKNIRDDRRCSKHSSAFVWSSEVLWICQRLLTMASAKTGAISRSSACIRRLYANSYNRAAARSLDLVPSLQPLSRRSSSAQRWWLKARLNRHTMAYRMLGPPFPGIIKAFRKMKFLVFEAFVKSALFSFFKKPPPPKKDGISMYMASVALHNDIGWTESSSESICFDLNKASLSERTASWKCPLWRWATPWLLSSSVEQTAGLIVWCMILWDEIWMCFEIYETRSGCAALGSEIWDPRRSKVSLIPGRYLPVWYNMQLQEVLQYYGIYVLGG